MTVRRSDAGVVILEGVCTVEDAEPLLRMLQATPAPAVDWTSCATFIRRCFRLFWLPASVPIGPCGDAWVRQWLASELRQRQTAG